MDNHTVWFLTFLAHKIENGNQQQWNLKQKFLRTQVWLPPHRDKAGEAIEGSAQMCISRADYCLSGLDSRRLTRLIQDTGCAAQANPGVWAWQ